MVPFTSVCFSLFSLVPFPLYLLTACKDKEPERDKRVIDLRRERLTAD